MYRIALYVILSISVISCSSSENTSFMKPPKKENIWVFLMAGQSNMAGRGTVEAQDTVSHPRILTIDSLGNWKLAVEPLHFYEPNLVGLDCGLSFGKKLIESVPDSVTIALIPTAVGGSAISQWINDENYRNVSLLSNFKEKVKIAQTKGIVKDILWHQGESDAYPDLTEKYATNMNTLFSTFRTIIGDQNLPIIVGELGPFFPDQNSWDLLNAEIQKYVASDPNTYLIRTRDLNHKGDSLHFDSPSLRMLGQRYAKNFTKLIQ